MKKTKKFKSLIALLITLALVFSMIPLNVFAAVSTAFLTDISTTTAWTSAKIQNGTVTSNTNSGTKYDTGLIATSSTATVSEEPTVVDPTFYVKNPVAVDSTFTLTAQSGGNNYIYLGAPNADKSTTNDKLVHVYKYDSAKTNNLGDEMTGFSVFNSNTYDSNAKQWLGSDMFFHVTLNSGFEFDTKYVLEVKAGFAIWNKKLTSMSTSLSQPVYITFKTIPDIAKITPTSAFVSGSTLEVSGLPCSGYLAAGSTMQYCTSSDGKTYGNWESFTYTGTDATITLNPELAASNNVTCKIGYLKKGETTPSVTSDAISINFASLSTPSLLSSVISGKEVILKGLPSNSKHLEYRIASNGTTYGEWGNLTVTDTKATIDVSALSIVAGTSKIQIRYKADGSASAGPSAESTIFYSLASDISLTKGNSVNINNGSVIINASSLNEGTNIVSVTSSATDGSGFDPTAWGFSSDFKTSPQAYCNGQTPSCGGAYSFDFNLAGDTSNDKISITLPYKLPSTPDVPTTKDNKLDDSKVGIWMLAPYHYFDDAKQKLVYYYWKYIPATVNGDGTVTVELNASELNLNQLVLSVRYDVYVDNLMNLSLHQRTENSFVFGVSAFDWSGTKTFIISRTEKGNEKEGYKEFILDSNSSMLKKELQIQNSATYGYNEYSYFFTDNTVEKGKDYSYKIEAAEDNYGNWQYFSSGGHNLVQNVYLDSAEDHLNRIIKILEDSYENPITITDDWWNQFLQYNDDDNSIKEQLAMGRTETYSPVFRFAKGDSSLSVTQNFYIPHYVMNIANLTVTSSDSDVIEICDYKDINKYENENAFLAVVHPQVDKNGNPIDTTVYLTVTIKEPGLAKIGAAYGIDEDTVTKTLTFPIVVKWPKGESKVDGASGNTTVTVDKDAINDAVFNDSEKLSIKKGADSSVKITCNEVKSPDGAKYVLNALSGQTYKGIRYFDIDIFKSIEGSTEQSVTSLSTPISITIPIPSDLQGKGYDFSIVRVHNGVATTLKATVSDDGKYITFKSDTFSTYALVYSEKSVITDSATPKASATAKTGSATDTGDQTPVITIAAVTVGAAMAELYLLRRRKRKENELI